MPAYAIKIALFGLPAIIALLWWWRTGVVSKTLYALSWANVLTYLVWLFSVSSLTSFSGVPVGLLMTPLFAAGVSLVLVFWSKYTARTERWKGAVSNALMLLLWLNSLIAPN
jgi:hypothetical protein